MKIGIFSFAHLHAEAYIQNLRSITNVEVIGIADENRDRGEKYSTMFDTTLFRDYDALLKEKPDGVLICSENNHHRRLVEMAASAGVNVLCEKPLATTVEDAQAIVNACNRAGVHLMTAFPVRFSAPVNEVKKRLDAGDLGKVLCINSTNQGENPRKYRDWFVDLTLAGGGALADHIVHLVDLMRWYLQSEVVEVYAQANRIFHSKTVDVESGGLVMVSFSNGVFATIDCSWCRPDYWPSWGGLTFELVSDRGAVIVDAFKQNLTVYQQDNQRPIWAFWGSDLNHAMVNEFVTAIQLKRDPLITGIDGLRAVEVVVAAYESLESGQPVRI